MFGDSNDQSGTVGLLVGVIVLVFVGIFFSLMADRRFQFSSDRLSVEESLRKGVPQLEELRREVAAANERLREEAQPVDGQAEQLKQLALRIKDDATRIDELRDRRDGLVAELEAATEAFRAYRADYRKHVRAEAAGERHAELETPGGRTYSDVTIRRVTAAGIEIMHAQGISRLLPKELGAEWNQRFQWDREEVEMVLQKEKAAAERHARDVARSLEGPKVAVATKPAAKKREARQEARQQLTELRQAVREAKARMEAAESETALAWSEAQTNRGRSVPGSLETWETKAKRLEAVSAKLRARYHAARGRLAVVSPRDPLLRDSDP